MCFQLVEIYTACQCLYYQHAVDRCSAYGRPGHGIQRRTIPVGYACSQHSRQHSSSAKYTGLTTSRTVQLGNPQPAQHKKQKKTDNSTKQVSNKPPVQDPLPLPRQQKKFTWSSEKAASTISRQESAKRQENSQKPAEQTSRANPNEETLAVGPSDAEESGSSSSDNWESESVVSVASSTTTIDGDTVGALFNKLLNFGDLPFLWPQLIAQSGPWKRSQRTIERLLHRYAQDLDKLAKNIVSNEIISDGERATRIKASKFVRQSRGNLAQRICEAHYRDESEQSSHSENISTESSEKKHESDSEDEDESLFVLEAVETFLFRTEPILYLQSNVKALLSLRTPRATSLVTWMWNDAQLRFENMLGSLVGAEKSALRGSTRLKWTCACGKALHDDFVELRPGALGDLHKLLQEYGKESDLNSRVSTTQEIMETLDAEGITNQGPSPQRGDWKQSIQAALSGFRGLATALGTKSPSLPHHRQGRGGKGNIIGACVRTELGGAGTHNFLLLCVPFMRVATKLYQPEICRINSDQEFFQLLRHYYQAKRGKSPWKLMRKVKSIQFVKFEMYRSNLADIRLFPSIPPAEKTGTEYGYHPGWQPHQQQQDTDVLPPIGPNLLAHLFEHPEHAEVIPVLWKRIPRKLRAELEACAVRGSSLGWGLQLAEGMEWFMLFVLGCAGFLVCLLVSVVWSAVKGDVQGGFAIGGFLLAFLIFCGSMVHLMIVD